VPVIVEVFTDNQNRTAPEIRMLFKSGQLGTPGSNKFLFDHVGLVEAYRAEPDVDIEAAAIEAGANEVETLSSADNDSIPDGGTGARFVTERSGTHSVSQWLSQNGWTVVTSETGHVAKKRVELAEAQRVEVGEFLQALDDHDDVHRVWAAI
jgi:transcriptional/translational regulatory protein YebC/TACO1